MEQLLVRVGSVIMVMLILLWVIQGIAALGRMMFG